MKENRITRAADVFLDALNNKALEKFNCSMCAVGNLISAGGYKFKDQKTHGIGRISNLSENAQWMKLLQNEFRGDDFALEAEGIAKKHLDSTEFSYSELNEIELCFEKNTVIKSCHYKEHTKEEIRIDQLNGLTAVLNLISTFDEKEKINVKEVFTDKAELIPIR